MLCGEVAILLSNILKLSGVGIENLHVAGDVLVSIKGTEIEEGLISDIGEVELMIADGQDVVINVLEDRIGEHTIWRFRIAESVPVVKIA